MRSQSYLNISSIGPRDVGFEDAHHVESISKLIWNLLKNWKCQPFNSLKWNNIRGIPSNINAFREEKSSRDSRRSSS